MGWERAQCIPSSDPFFVAKGRGETLLISQSVYVLRVNGANRWYLPRKRSAAPTLRREVKSPLAYANYLFLPHLP